MEMIMNIETLQGHSPSLPPSDANIVIDVIRAFTTTHEAFLQGAREVLLAKEIDQAFALKKKHPDYLLAGERHSIKVEGFDLGNSPHECSQIDFSNRAMILTTSHGVQATMHALHEGLVLVTGYSNAQTTAEFLGRQVETNKISRINLLASHPTGDEDLACAEFLRDRLLDRYSMSHAEVQRRIRGSEAAQKFLDPTQPNFDTRDIERCARPRAASFVMEVVKVDDVVRIRAR
jgi:2-phosphosulfolactate phosphatase